MVKVAVLGMACADLVMAPLKNFHIKEDVTPLNHMQVSAGGDAANVALNLISLHVDCGLFCKIGQDIFGNWLMEYYQQQGLSKKNITQDPKISTSTVAVLIADDGERKFLYHGGGNDALSVQDINFNDLLSFDIIHVSGYFLLPNLEQSLVALFKDLQVQGKITSLDVGWDTKGRWINLIGPLLPHLDYFMPTLNEAQQITSLKTAEECAEFFLDYGVKNIVIKAGARGAYAQNQTEKAWIASQKVKNIVDTTGAGDGFVSGFLSGISRGKGFLDAVATGNKVGAAVIQQYGATGAIYDEFNG